MNSLNFYCGALLAFFSCSLLGCETELKQAAQEYSTRQAIESDIPDIVDLINTHACKDSDKIVIVPEQFRAAYIQSAVCAGRLFVISHAKKIVGYKKLFCITDNHERDEILKNELRCTGTNPAVIGSISIDMSKQQEASSQDLALLFSKPVIYIYNGADFTHPDYRSKGLNARLTNHALAAVAKVTADQMQRLKSTHIALVFGLTRSNAGTEKNVLGGRTKGIVQQFIPFVQSVAQACNSRPQSTLLLSRHRAFKPSFDPNAAECKPLSDDKAIPGYGCLVAIALGPKEGTCANNKDELP